MEKTATSVSRFRMGWKSRHLLVIILAVVGTWAFLESRAQWSDMHRWNRAVGDMSFLLIAMSMAIGPLSRLVSRLKILVPWRRELGIYGVILAAVHTIIILAGWIEWDLVRIFGFQLHPSGSYVMVQHGFGLANVIGLVALFYGMVLALSSSNWSQRLMGGSVWKFLQQGAYVLWMLIIVHTAYFLFLHFLDFHRSVPEPNWVQVPFSVLVGLVIILQMAAFVKTWISRRNRLGGLQQPQAG
ncbi:MAG: ferric reductase-like transmembrane domain-containing protein [Devosiaceae bacterium]|nr:ferric reductase-like transmembrane domain-containing protein [Devosiaceae bacterium]